MHKYLIIFFTLLLITCTGQNRRKLDSLLRQEKFFKSDTTAIINYYKIAGEYYKQRSDSSFSYINKAMALSLQLKRNDLYAKSYNEKIYFIKASSVPGVLIDTLLAIYHNPIINSEKRYFQNVCYELGIAFRKTDNYDKSIQYLQQALKLAQELGDKKKLYNTYNSLANSYAQTGVTKKAVDDLRKALQLYSKSFEFIDSSNRAVAGMIINNKGVANYNIGQLTKDSSETKKAIAYFKESLAIRIEQGDSIGIADSYGNIGSSYHDLSDVHKDYSYLDISKSWYEKAIVIDSIINKKINYNLLSNYGTHLALMGKVRKNKMFLQNGVILMKRSLAESDVEGNVYSSMVSCKNIAQSYEDLKLPDSAVVYYKKHLTFKDSILSAENKQIAEELMARYESDLKDAENNNLKQQAELREEVISKKSNTIKIMIAASIIMLFLGVLIFISRQKIRLQKIETEKQKILIEEKQKEIVDSINYSKRLQDAAIPSMDYFRSLLPDSFIFYQPKDIVAGDFYWIHQFKKANEKKGTRPGRLLVAAADCTGHGVPGALVSIVCLNALNRCVEELGLQQPSEILDKASDIIMQSFRQSENDVKDGMDVALCLLDLKLMKGHFSGANNPLWIIRNGGLTEIKGDSQPVGQQHVPKPFTQREFELQSGDILLMSSDGYADQFGGPNATGGGKKLKTKKFKELCLQHGKHDINAFEHALRSFFMEWKGENEQVDDVLVVGIRI